MATRSITIQLLLQTALSPVLALRFRPRGGHHGPVSWGAGGIIPGRHTTDRMFETGRRGAVRIRAACNRRGDLGRNASRTDGTQSLIRARHSKLVTTRQLHRSHRAQFFAGAAVTDCLAADNIPSEVWADNQITHHCTDCERKFVVGHFCRGVHMCTPFTHR